MINHYLSDMIELSRDGEWGESEPFDSCVEMAAIRGTDFDSVRQGEVSSVPVRFVKAHLAEYKRLRGGEILIEAAGGTKGRITGRTIYLNARTISRFGIPVTCASFSRFIRLKQSNQWDTRYIFWLLQYLYHFGFMDKYHTQHTGVSRFQWTVFSENEPLHLPPLPTQRKIAAILSAYDDLIENNLRRIKILEEMAQNLYREWFVHFRYPGHASVTLVDSPLGPIPQGWEVKAFPDMVTVRPSLAVPNTDRVPFVPMSSLSNNSMLIGEIEYRSKASGSRFQNGDTLFARITPCLENGKTGFVQFLPNDETVSCGSTEFIVLRSKSLCPELVYLLARSELFRDNAIKSMSGASGRQRVQEECFTDFLMAQPPSSILELFHSSVHPQFEMIHTLNLKNNNLRRTHDFLLPRLVSGALDVSDLDIDTGRLIP